MIESISSKQKRVSDCAPTDDFAKELLPFNASLENIRKVLALADRRGQRQPTNMCRSIAKPSKAAAGLSKAWLSA